MSRATVEICDLGLRQELVQRRIEEADRDRHSVQLAEDAFEVVLLIRQQLIERVPPPFLVAREDHLAHAEDAFLLKEHVLGAAQADARRAEQPRHARVLRRVGVRAHAHRADRVRPLQQAIEIAEDFGLLRLHRLLDEDLDHFGRPRRKLVADDLAGGAVDRQPVAFLERLMPLARISPRE